MNDYLYRVRDRFHPLNHLRRHSVTRALLRTIDIPIWASLPGVGCKVRVRLVRHASSIVLYAGVEPRILALFYAIAHKFGIRSFWDVGANVGYYSWLTKSVAPEVEVRLFEPDPDNLTLIRETMRRAALPGVTVRGVAVSDRCGTRSFARDEVSGATGGIQETSGTYSERQWGVGGGTLMVNTVSLDEERVNAQPVDLIKIDVEGHEEAVIRGARKTIEGDQPIVIFECFHGGTEISNALEPLGYWISDAERMSSGLDGATNFLALPKRYHSLFDELKLY